MKTIFTLVLLVLATRTVVNAQNTSDTDSVDKKISAHFEEYQSERFRYSGLTLYGETAKPFEKDQIVKELSLFEQIRESELVNHPPENVFALCHNILIHSPETGREFLRLLNQPSDDKNILALLYGECIFTGEFGEGLALDNLESANESWSKKWSQYLSRMAIYESSLERIQAKLKQTTDVEVTTNLISALMYIGNPESAKIVKDIIETTTNDEVQAKAIFAFVELTGYDGLIDLHRIITVGEKSKEEKASSIDWLKKETSPKNKFGTEVENDIDFIMRFGDIKSPAILWLEKEGLLTEKKAKKPLQLTNEKKEQLLDLLIESKGFGLEAAKGHLLLSIEPSDIDKLLRLRQMCLYSPNDFTSGQLNTIGIFVRFLRKKAS